MNEATQIRDRDFVESAQRHAAWHYKESQRWRLDAVRRAADLEWADQRDASLSQLSHRQYVFEAWRSIFSMELLSITGDAIGNAIAAADQFGADHAAKYYDIPVDLLQFFIGKGFDEAQEALEAENPPINIVAVILEGLRHAFEVESAEGGDST